MTFRELAQQLYGEWKFIMATPNEPTQMPDEQLDPLAVQRLTEETVFAREMQRQVELQHQLDQQAQYEEFIRRAQEMSRTQQAGNPLWDNTGTYTAPIRTAPAVDWAVDPAVGVIPGPNNQPLRWVRPDEWYRDPVRPNSPQELNPVDEGRKMDRAMTVAPPFTDDEKVNLVQYNLLQILKRYATVFSDVKRTCPRCKNAYLSIGKFSNDWVVGKCSNAGCLSFYGYMKDLT